MTVPGAGLVRRSSVVLFALYTVLGTTLASAQTVILRHTPPGSTVELVLNGRQAGTATADAGGNATVTTKSLDTHSQIDANIWLETCDDVYRVILAAPGAPAPAGGCRRTQIGGVYVVQRITSIVIDANNSSPVLIRQGAAYSSWLTDPRPEVAKPVKETETQTTAAAPAASASASKSQPPLKGPFVFGGVGLGTALNFEEQVCGTVTCTYNVPIQYGGGVGWWFNDFFGVEGRYGYLGKVTATGNETDFQFSTTRESGFLAVAGRAGLHKGRFRPFGRAGMSFDRTTLTTKQTMGESMETLAMRARGWAPVFGGGLEFSLSPRFGLYVDAQRLGLKGKDEQGSGIEVDDTLLTAQAGLTIRFR
jgi:hypothetical protein